MKKKNLQLIAVLLLFLFAACDYHFIEDPVLPDEPISFSQELLPVFQQKCVECHTDRTPVLTEQAAYNSLIDGNYVNTTTPEDSEIYNKTKGGHPPGSRLSPEELAKLLKWIEEGANNN